MSYYSTNRGYMQAQSHTYQ